MTYIMTEYDAALEKILNHGFDIDGDRTGKGTRCAFGLSTSYDISERVPIMTKRKVSWKAILREVLWYISGSHSIAELEQRNCGIWTPWKSDEFTDKHKLPKGSGGYIYGFNLIHFGAEIRDVEFYKSSLALYNRYIDLPPDETSERDREWAQRGLSEVEAAFDGKLGFNQLDYVINTLRANPKSRQACFTFWRPDTNSQAVLPACHAMYSFIVSPDAKTGELNVLNCHMFQRSCDYPIGVGHGNLWTATLFTYMIAAQLGMKPGMLYHSGAHCHIYHNSIDQTTEYLSRTEAPPSPKLVLNPDVKSIYDYREEDFDVIGYEALPSIKFEVAV